MNLRFILTTVFFVDIRSLCFLARNNMKTEIMSVIFLKIVTVINTDINFIRKRKSQQTEKYNHLYR